MGTCRHFLAPQCPPRTGTFCTIATDKHRWAADKGLPFWGTRNNRLAASAFDPGKVA
jgi:hypothetical protein